MVEGDRLESGYTVMSRIVSSNLIPSAIKSKPQRTVGFAGRDNGEYQRLGRGYDSLRGQFRGQTGLSLC